MEPIRCSQYYDEVWKFECVKSRLARIEYIAGLLLAGEVAAGHSGNVHTVLLKAKELVDLIDAQFPLSEDPDAKP